MLRRFSAFVILVGLALGAVLLGRWAVLESAGQSKAEKKEEVEEDEPAKPPAKSKVPKREEVEDDDSKPDETQPVNLGAEAKKATGDVQEFFQSLAYPYDELHMRGGRVDHVVPLKEFIGAAPNFQGRLKPTKITKEGKRIPLPHAIGKKDVASVKPFEEIALAKTDELLQKNRDLRHLQAAEKALVFALRLHLKARDRTGENEKRWKLLEMQLRDKWVAVRVDQVDALALKARELSKDTSATQEAKDAAWQSAFALAEQLAKEHPGSRAVHFQLAQLALDHAQATETTEHYVAARRAFLTYVDRFPDSRKIQLLRDRLAGVAEKWVAEADDLAAKDKPAAILRLKKAAQVWPELKNLQEKLRALDLDNPVLYVGVKELPQKLSPATACTDAEKQAVELLFESLVQPDYEDGTWHYAPQLADARPQVMSLGRHFHLDEDARWSDGKRVVAPDIRETVRLLKMPKLPGRDSSWARLVAPPRADKGPEEIDITLDAGCMDPLSFMTFKILPRQVGGKPLSRADDESFAEHPVGSGPYQYQGTEAGEGGRYAVFTANPFYQRASRRGRPFIREIRFFVYKDLAGAFRDGRLHLLLDLPTARVKAALEAGLKPDNILTLPNRRVYFLAVNHTNESLQNVHLRKALAHAIDRETLLKTQFRAGYAAVDRQGKLSTTMASKDRPLHPALNGPYPARSWACSPSVPESLFELDRAKTEGNRALAKLGTVQLTLKYPNDDDRVEKACRDICAQVDKAFAGKIKITAEGLAPRAFQQAIRRRQYDLAYCHRDYASEAFWLQPLFDPEKNARDPGGSNFLRYQNDSELESLFHKTMTYRNFSQVKKVTHDIHEHLHDKMPLIPLWQLDTHIGVHPLLQPVGLDPLVIFSKVDQWKLERK
jgi:ABC-type transport system substrate-binding protein